MSRRIVPQTADDILGDHHERLLALERKLDTVPDSPPRGGDTVPDSPPRMYAVSYRSTASIAGGSATAVIAEVSFTLAQQSLVVAQGVSMFLPTNSSLLDYRPTLVFLLDGASQSNYWQDDRPLEKTGGQRKVLPAGQSWTVAAGDHTIGLRAQNFGTNTMWPESVMLAVTTTLRTT